MEVHHHSHPGKKKFKEYFFEFFMLFLAVTLGFFVENLRESIVSHERETHYIKGILTDLEKDTADLSLSFTAQNGLINRMDNVLNIPLARLNNISAQDSLYKEFVPVYTGYWIFVQSNNTVTQLKNAGGFNVFGKQEVIDSITATYYYFDAWIKINSEEYVKSYQRTCDIARQLIRLPVPPLSGNESITKVPSDQAGVLIQSNRILLEQLYSEIRFQKGQILVNIQTEKEYEEKVKRLINFLKKEYHL